MDDAKLKKILQEIDVPDADLNAQKRAVNLAVSEFKAHSQEKEKKFQGNSILSRLMGRNSQSRRETMEQKSNKKLVRGTAMLLAGVALVALPVAMTQMNETVGTSANVDVESVDADSGNNFSNIASNVSNSTSVLGGIFGGKRDSKQAPAEIQATPGTEGASEVYREAVRETNEAVIEEAFKSGGSALPVPIDPAPGIISQRTEQRQAVSEKQVRDRLMRPEMEMAEADMAVAPAPALSSVSPLNKDMAAGQAANRLVAPKEKKAQMAEPSIMPISPPVDDLNQGYYQDEGRDKFEDFQVNPFKQVSAEPVSTFSVDVDTASYSFMRRQLNSGRIPSAGSIRTEELINYFDYNYPLPEDASQPFKPTVTLVDSPWAEGKKLMHVGIKGFDIDGPQPKSNLVFLLDISGSMNSPDKLPLLKNSLKMLLNTLNEDDTVSIVTYAGHTGVALEPTPVSQKSTILNAMDNLRAGGGTAGAAGIELAYKMAEENFNDEAVNRVILATDGDFNVGISDPKQLEEYVEKKRNTGIFLSVLGFGQGNYNDHIMQSLAQNGNGVAAYIDNLNEARKVLVEEATSSLFPIAKDVKIQVEFNPKAVAEYRLVGYETRHLNREDFNNDKVDAGDIGAGHSVTAIYEITPVGSSAVSVDPLRYGDAEVGEKKYNMDNIHNAADFEGEIAFLKMRYKLPKENVSKLITTPITTDLDGTAGTEQTFATAVAGFAQILQGGQHLSVDFTYDDVIALAQKGKGEDTFGYRAEFINLVRLAKSSAQ